MALYVHIVLNMPLQSYKIGPYARTVHDDLKDNPRFPDAGAVLAVLGPRIQALNESLSGGTAAQRKAAREGVKEALGHARDHVQGVAETAAGTVDLLAIQALVESVGMRLRKVG